MAAAYLCWIMSKRLTQTILGKSWVMIELFTLISLTHLETFASSWSIVVGRGSMLTSVPMEHMGMVGNSLYQCLNKSGFF